MAPSHRAVARCALALAAVVLLTRVWIAGHRSFDVDEFEHAHAAWCTAQGLVPYRDFFEHHTPALYFLFAPLFAQLPADARGDEAIRFMILSRGAMWVLTLASLVLTYRIGVATSGAVTGALSVAALATSFQFLNTMLEFRPDVPAVVCLLASIACLAEAWRGDARRPDVWTFAAGAAFGAALMFTQKALFAAPGLAFAAAIGGRPRRWPWFVVGCVAPAAVALGWFAAHGALAAFLDANVSRNVALLGDRESPLPRFFESALVNAPLYGLGAAGAVAAYRAHRTDLRTCLLATLISFLAGLAVIARSYDQYYVLFLPLVAVLAADFLASRSIALSRSAAIAAGVAVALLLAASILSFRSNEAQADDVAFVMARTRSDEAVLSGVPGAGTFRPHAWFYFFLSGPFASARDYADLQRSLESQTIRPRVVIFDKHLRAMPAAVTDYLRAHYRHVRGDIFERAD